MALWTLSCIIIILIKSAIFGYDLDWSLRVRQICMAGCLNIIGAKINVKSPPPKGVFLYCGNHRSYLDPIVVLRDVLVLPVAKAEVSNWPLIGYGAKVTGIMFVKRENRNSRKATIEAMQQVLKNGNSVIIYPEGTTHDHPTTIDFKVGAFRLAAEMGIPVIPIAIEYEKRSAAWIGDDTFIPHFLKTFGDWQTNLTIEYGEPILEDNKIVLLEKTKNWIDQKMLEISGRPKKAKV